MPKKQLSVGVPATLNLKAELERARQECKADSSNSKSKPKSSPYTCMGGQNMGVQSRAQKDKQALDSERLSRAFTDARARQILEEKAHLYDLLSTADSDASAIRESRLDEHRIAKILEESPVDFVSKQIEHLRRRSEHRKGDRDAASSSLGQTSHSDSASMVEVVDEFGRSRMVPRSEACKYRQRPGSAAVSSDTSSNSDSDASSGSERIPDRSSRGIGYYSLSLAPERRKEQISTLQQLHNNTVQVREETAISSINKQRQLLDQRRAQLRSSHERFVSSSAGAAHAP
ncbi:hypothetical protein GGI04_000254 [Coemansia thaxteri]|uniref:Uncharacterized protein n=1 Tax=Coemansia thaxteri TaxID=2663907 RepID=A0A9W8BME3_9FUNG|nr:hypothetical protein H4R26_000586 [Coemansia thaxteri]KAJ2009682.1 hypothetical protein GGI04_000254 [Coemansia thaxteri]KAJ2474341.1 hypothetical protein GGI02_000138 [Coemansia sp. RSA 2322]KAJ2486225.1 hypothetical protein EV174_001245 [Coemansia sp. RSA 2320]